MAADRKSKKPAKPSAATVIRRYKAGCRSLSKGIPSAEERRAAGRELRKKTPRSSHAEWSPPRGRRDAVDFLLESETDRVQPLLPIRHGRMASSSFAFLRGSAAQMAADLQRSPVSGLEAWLCGDAHLSNFGLYASPERDLVFDINDFDETIPGPWEWDLKRLVASVEVAGRARGFKRRQRTEAVCAAVKGYREAIGLAASMPLLALFSFRVDESVFKASRVWAEASEAERARAERTMRKAEQRTNDHALDKLAQIGESGEWEFVKRPPLLERVDRKTAGGLAAAIDRYAEETLTSDRQELLRSFVIRDIAFKVVGVGSVGTRAYAALLIGNGSRDALFLQVKEAGESQLTPYLKSDHGEHGGQRVVHGQRRLQSVSDPLLGWTEFDGRSYYVRQLRDMKGSIDVDTMVPRNFLGYARLCGAILAKGHARTGDPAAIAGYCGTGDVLDLAMAEFATRYADQTEADHAALVDAIGEGRVEAEAGI